MTHFKKSFKKRFKKTAAITGLVMIAAAPFASASDNKTLSKATQAKQGATVFSSILVGTAAGGPAGAFIGLLASSFFVDKIADADQLQQTTLDLATAEAQTAELRRELMAARSLADTREQALQALALNSLDFQVLFHTGKDELTARGRERVASLAKRLSTQPQLQVRLDGHADPRGTDEYNNVLADYRSRSVADALLKSGIEPERIERYSHGSRQATASTGNAEQYAIERRVNIQVFTPQQSRHLVSSH